MVWGSICRNERLQFTAIIIEIIIDRSSRNLCSTGSLPQTKEQNISSLWKKNQMCIERCRFPPALCGHLNRRCLVFFLFLLHSQQRKCVGCCPLTLFLEAKLSALEKKGVLDFFLCLLQAAFLIKQQQHKPVSVCGLSQADSMHMSICQEGDESFSPSGVIYWCLVPFINVQVSQVTCEAAGRS